MADFVIISDAYWTDPIWVSRHFIPSSLSKHHRVLYIERATTWITPLAYGEPWSTLYQGLGLTQIDTNIWTYRPVPRLPFDRRYRVLSKLNQRILATEINRAIAVLGLRDPHIITYDHKAAVLFRHVKTHGKRCYYVVDEISEFNWPMASRETILADEADTIKASDFIIATSRPLLEKCRHINPASHILSHGVDIDAYLDPQPIPNDLEKIPKPRVGFIGKIEEWVDLDLINSLALHHPELSFVFVGPIRSDVTSLKDLNNVHFLGARARELMPAYLGGFDIGLIPFKQNELTRNVNPLKLYEYLAAGIPVLSTPMEAVRPDEELGVYVEHTPDGFANALADLKRSETPERREARRQFASSHSWQGKARWLTERFEASQ